MESTQDQIEPQEENQLNQQDEQQVKINEQKLNDYMEKLKLEQNLPLGILGGVLASIVGAILWAAITVATEYQIGYMAIAVGFLVGYTIRFMGKGIDQVFGISGAILSVIGCLLGNFFSIVGFIANAEGLGYVETLSLIEISQIPEIMGDTFQIMDLLFYGIAIYEGYNFSFRQVTEEEIIEHASE